MGHYEDWVTLLEKNNLIRFDPFNRCFFENIWRTQHFSRVAVGSGETKEVDRTGTLPSRIKIQLGWQDKFRAQWRSKIQSAVTAAVVWVLALCPASSRVLDVKDLIYSSEQICEGYHHPCFCRWDLEVSGGLPQVSQGTSAIAGTPRRSTWAGNTP